MKSRKKSGCLSTALWIILAIVVLSNPSLLFIALIVGIIWLIAIIVNSSKERKKALINDKVDSIKNDIGLAYSAASVSSYIAIQKRLNESVAQLAEPKTAKKIRKYDIDTSGVLSSVTDLTENYQWYLRNAIDRQKTTVIKDLKTTYKNSKEHKERAYYSYANEIDQYASLYSDETADFAEEAKNKVYNVTGLYIPCAAAQSSPALPSKTLEVSSSNFTSVQDMLDEIDGMDGNKFEHLCAAILSHNGFNGVQVTQSSGDQGVDIIASKDGIRYAIQCKCYSHDLGNTPIQEVHAGKSIYNCHVGAVLTNRYFTAGAVKAAQQTNTLLWDRDKLQQYIGIYLESVNYSQE